jgi:hypothetical protein
MFNLSGIINRSGLNSVNAKVGSGQLAAMRAQAVPREVTSTVAAITHGDVSTALQQGIAAKTNATATVSHVEQKLDNKSQGTSPSTTPTSPNNNNTPQPL